jgi:hypothetical protein
LAEHARRLFHRDEEISQHYNQAIAGGKWSHMMDQTHIGYSSWQEPPQNVMPKVETIELPAIGSLAVAVEGSDEYWPHKSQNLALPKLNSVDHERHYFEVFNRGKSRVSYSIATDVPWLRVVRDPSSAESDGVLEQQQRHWVEVDWAKLSPGEHRATIKIASSDGAGVNVDVTADHFAPSLPDRFAGHVDTNGYVSIDAEHFGGAFAADPIEWQIVPGLGRTQSGVIATPVTAASQLPGDGTPHLQYPVFLSKEGVVKVQAYVSPTLNFHNSKGLRYAVSFDDQPPQIVNIHDGETLQAWEKWVADNINITSSEHQLATSGVHVLKFWRVDPGVVLQKLIVDTGGLRPSYLGPPESMRRTPSSP